MWVNHVILALMGLFAGFAVSAGTFAFLIAIGVIPRLIGKSNTAMQPTKMPAQKPNMINKILPAGMDISE